MTASTTTVSITLGLSGYYLLGAHLNQDNSSPTLQGWIRRGSQRLVVWGYPLTSAISTHAGIQLLNAGDQLFFEMYAGTPLADGNPHYFFVHRLGG